MIPLGPDAIHLWTLPLGGAPPQWPEVLSEEENFRASRFVRQEDAERFRICRSNLRQILARYLDVRAQSIVLATTDAGRPYLDLPIRSDINFNISHCQSKLFIVIGRQAHLGVDGEDRMRGRDLGEIVGLAFGADEQAELGRLDAAARAGAILRGWTRKEAIAKALGQGFLVDPRAFRVPLTPGTRWRVPVPGGVQLDLADISDTGSVAALAAGQIRDIPAPRALATLFAGGARAP